MWNLLLICTLLINCHLTVWPDINTNDVEYIKIYSLPRDLVKDHAITSKDKLIEWNKMGDNASIMCRDTSIRSVDDINKFVSCVNSLKRARGRCSIDIRTLAVLHLHSGEEINLCFGAFFGTTINGIPVKDNPTLFNFLTDKIYSPHENDPYYWAGKIMRVIIDTPPEE